MVKGLGVFYHHPTPPQTFHLHCCITCGSFSWSQAGCLSSFSIPSCKIISILLFGNNLMRINSGLRCVSKPVKHFNCHITTQPKSTQIGVTMQLVRNPPTFRPHIKEAVDVTPSNTHLLQKRITKLFQFFCNAKMK